MRKIILLLALFLCLSFVVPPQTVQAGAIGCYICCENASACAGFVAWGCSAPSVAYYSCQNKNTNTGWGNCNHGCGVCNICNNYPAEDCGISYENGCSGGGGSGDYQYFKCPDGQVKSCGSPAEAQTQGKYACLVKSFCDTYFSPELIEAPAPCNENPASAICQWNCSCCPIDSYRSCTLGTSCIITATKER